jgi:preprotein translocase subunit SecE
MADAEKKTSPVQFVKQVKAEIKKVTWPTRKETVISTIMVFIMVIFAAIFLFMTDQIVATIIQWILG